MARIYWGSTLNNPRVSTSWEPSILAISRANGRFKSRWSIFTLSKKQNPNQIKYAVGVSEVTPDQQVAIDADPVNVFYLNSTQIKQQFSTLPAAMQNRINSFCKQINLASPANNEILYDLWNRMSLATDNKTLTALEAELDNDLKIAKADGLELVIVPTMLAAERDLKLYRRQLLKLGLISVATYMLWPKPAQAAVVFSDNFNVGVDTPLDAYPSGTPNYMFLFGSGSGNMYVNAANDRIQQDTDFISDYYPCINAAMPMGDQRITATVYSDAGINTLIGFLLRSSTTTPDYYLANFVKIADEVGIYRDDGDYNDITLAVGSRPLATYPATCYAEALGAGATVTINVVSGTTTVVTYADSSVSRNTSGVPGVYMRSGDTSSADVGYIDNLSVDNLVSTPVTARRRAVVVQ